VAFLTGDSSFINSRVSLRLSTFKMSPLVVGPVGFELASAIGRLLNTIGELITGSGTVEDNGRDFELL